MKTDRRPRRLAITGIAAAVALAGITGLAATRPATVPLPAEQISAAEPITTEATGQPTSEPLDILQLPLGEAFAREVAGAVFDWDTTAVARDDVITSVLAIADEDEANGLLFDLDAYLPSEPDWRTLRDLQTRQRLDIDVITVPDAWGQIVVDNPGQVTPGTIAYTITGTRHRDGQWHGAAEVFDEPVAFTAFVACADGDSGGHCVLLRLSALNKPLD